MKCSNCGKEIDDNSKFCEYCGNRIKLERRCPKCGKILKEDTLFCNECGFKLSEDNLNNSEVLSDINANEVSSIKNEKEQKKKFDINQFLQSAKIKLDDFSTKVGKAIYKFKFNLSNKVNKIFHKNETENVSFEEFEIDPNQFKKYGYILFIIVITSILIIFPFIGGRSAKTTLNEAVKIYCGKEENSENVLKLMHDDLVNQIAQSYILDEDARNIAEAKEKMNAEILSELKDKKRDFYHEYGSNYTYSYKIIDQEVYLAKDYDTVFHLASIALDKDISGGKKFEVRISIKNGGKVVDTFDRYYYLYKVGNKWYYSTSF